MNCSKQCMCNNQWIHDTVWKRLNSFKCSSSRDAKWVSPSEGKLIPNIALSSSSDCKPRVYYIKHNVTLMLQWSLQTIHFFPASNCIHTVFLFFLFRCLCHCSLQVLQWEPLHSATVYVSLFSAWNTHLLCMKHSSFMH